MSQCGSFAFTVKDGYPASGGSPAQTPNITLEPRTTGLPVLQGGILQLYLRPGLDETKARELANLLNDYIEDVCYSPR